MVATCDPRLVRRMTVIIVLWACAGELPGAELMHFDPGVTASMFENGNATGGTDPIDAPYIGEVIRWMDSQVNNFDVQQATNGPTLVAGPSANSPYALQFTGGQNLLSFDFNDGNIVNPTVELDIDTLTIVVAGKATIGGSGTGHFINFNYDVGGANLVSLEYNHATGQLVGRVSGGVVSAPVLEGRWFVAELTWNSGSGVTLGVNGATVDTDASAAVAGVDFDRFRLGSPASTSAGSLNGFIGDVHIFNTASENNAALISQLVADYPNSGLPLLTADRGNGELKLTYSGSSRTMLGYSITSDFGALKPSNWKSIAENYDVNAAPTPGNGSVDSNDSWVELTNPAVRTDLSEFEPDGNGALLANNQTINLGVGAWIRSPTQDLKMQILFSDGTVENVAVDYMGNSGNPFVFGDLDFDGDFDHADFTGGFVPKYLTSTSGMSPAEKYQAGDFNADGVTNFFDFLIYNDAFLTANPGASALSLSVPEPGTLALFIAGALVFMPVFGRKKKSIAVVARRVRRHVMLTAGSTILGLLLAAPQACAIEVLHLDPNVMSTLFQNGNNTGGTTAVTAVAQPVRWISDVRSPTPGGAALDDYIDVQQAGTAAVLANAPAGTPGGTMLQWAGNGNLLGFDFDSGSVNGVANVDGPSNPFDTNTLTVILVGRVASTATALDTFIDLRDNTINGGFGLRYDNATGFLHGLVKTQAVANTSLGRDELFVASFAWDGPNSMATLKLTTESGSVTTMAAASNVAINHDRFRLGASAAGNTNQLTGLMGDVLVYNDVLDHSGVFAQLVDDYLPAPVLLTLQVSRITGDVLIRNNSAEAITIDAYRVTSELDSLNPTGWKSLQDQAFDGTPGNPVWFELGHTVGELSEGYFGGDTTVAASSTILLGRAFNIAETADLALEYHLAGASPSVLASGIVVYVDTPFGDVNFDGVVDIFDVNLVSSNWNTSGPEGDGNSDGVVDIFDINLISSHWNETTGGGGAAAVPEPAGVLLATIGCVGLLLAQRRRARRSGLLGGRTMNLSAIKTAFCAMMAVVLAAASATAAVTDDRRYLLGDDGLEDASAGIQVGSGPLNVSPGATLDSSPGGAGSFVNITVFGSPMYTSVSDRPGAAPGSLGVSFNGAGDYLRTAISMNAPTQMWDNNTFFPLGYPLNYESIFSHGISLWAQPNPAGLLAGQRQDLVIDTPQHGVFITAGGNWGLQFDAVSFDTGVAVNTVADNGWTHVMQVAGNDPVNGRSAQGGALYVNGVAVSVKTTFYDPSAVGLSIGANEDGSSNYYRGDLDDVRLFLWGDNSLENNGGGGPFGQNWGAFFLGSDNEWIAQKLTSLGVTNVADVNLNGTVFGDGTGSPATDDVSALIANWLSVRTVDGVVIGDWTSRQQGDINYDGRTNLLDAFLLHQSLVGGGGAGIDFGLFAGVPEPSSIVLAAMAGARRRRDRDSQATGPLR